MSDSVEIVLQGGDDLPEIFREPVADYVAMLIDDLALPIRCNVRVGDGSSSDPLALSMAGETVPLALDDTMWVDEQLNIVLVAVYRNRCRLLCEEAVRAFAKSAVPQAVLSDEAHQQLREMMRECVIRDLGLNRLADALAKVDPASWNAWETILALHSEETVRLSLSLGAVFYPSEHQPTLVSYFAGETPRLQREIYEASGILCPAPAVVFEDDLGRYEWRMRINDVRLPQRLVPSEATVAGVLGIFREYVLEDRQALLTREDVERRLFFVRETAPVLVEQIRERPGLSALCAILHAFARDKASFRALENVLEALTYRIALYDVDPAQYDLFTPRVETAIRKAANAAATDDYVRAVTTRLSVV